MELNDILKYQGIELAEDATIEDYKKTFDAQFLKKENALQDEEIRKALIGETTSKHAKELVRTAKENDIELTPEEKSLPVGDLSRLITAKQSEKYNSKIEELSAKGKKPSEELTALQQKFESLNSRYSEELSAKEELQGLLEKKENEFVGFKKDFKLNQAKSQIFGNLTYSDNANDIMKKGFMATVNEKYNIDLGEDDNPIITTKEGNRIKDPNKHGSFLSPVDVLSNELAEAGLAKKVDSEKFPKTEPTTYKPTEKRMDGNGVVKPSYAKPSKTLR